MAKRSDQAMENLKIDIDRPSTFTVRLIYLSTMPEPMAWDRYEIMHPSHGVSALPLLEV